MTSERHAPVGGSATVGDPGPDRRQDPMLGRLLDGRYQIVSRIARGGMATVYAATDRRLDRSVAVKVMHPGLGDDQDFAARFVAEARAAARLSHPNVVSVFDQGTDVGHGSPAVFLAMELVPGHTLRDTIAHESPLSPARALALLEPVVSALAAAHRAGLVHRDVKPENVLIATDPNSGTSRIKVADFGLAKAVTATTQHTATGVLIGTVSYIAPELVVEGRSDARADVYAVGVILYELLTGRKPHQGESPIQVAYKHVHEDVPAPSRLAPSVPEYVDALVARATARDREQRPADAGVLLHQLRRVGQALAAGVREDADLVSDLVPRATPTVSDPWDHAEMAALLAPEPAPAPRPDQRPDQRHEQRHERRPEPRPERRPEPTSRQQPARVPTQVPQSAPRPRTPPPPTPPARPRRRRRGPLLMVLALLVAAAVGTGAWWFGYARYTSTPGVIGLTQAQATQRLEAAGLEVATGAPAYSSTVPKGEVLGTDPAPGDRILGGGRVTVRMSLGVEVYRLPTLTGLGEDQAQDAIQGAHMSFGTARRAWSETVPKGQVVSSDPSGGTTLRPNTIVDLVVSRGRKPVQVASWVGKDAADAEKALSSQGLDVQRGPDQYSDTVPTGAVIAQTPEDGVLHLGDRVTLVVSKGPELVEVPSLRAHGVDAATAELESLGFQVQVENASEYLGLGYVFRTDPVAGTELPKGSTVTLYLI